MADKIDGYLEVGNDGRDIILNIRPETLAAFNPETGGHILFSPNQGRNLARLFNKNADELDGGEKEEHEVDHHTSD